MQTLTIIDNSYYLPVCKIIGHVCRKQADEPKILRDPTIGHTAVRVRTRDVSLVTDLHAHVKMADDKPVEEDEELLDYEEEEVAADEGAGAKSGEAVKKGYVGIHSTGFRDFLLKPELLRAIVDCGFEHPSEGTLRRRPRVCRFPPARRAIARARSVVEN